MPKATDRTFCDKLVQMWKGKSAHFEAHRFDQGFTLQHYAGKVEYGVEGWLEKNKDPLNDNLVRLLAQSKDSLLSELFGDSSDSSAAKFVKKGLFRTVAQRHRESLQLLMQTLQATQPHFVRCIIPNEHKQPDQLDAPLVLDQLRCNGVLEGIRICRQGYPHRLPFADFIRLYAILATAPLPTECKDACVELARQLQLSDQVALGHSKIFLRTGHLSRLDAARDQRLATLLTELQAHSRGYLQRRAAKRRLRQAEAAPILVKNAQAMLELRQWTWWRLYSRIIPLTDLFRNQQRVQEAAEELARVQRDREQQLASMRAALESERERIADLERVRREAERERLSLEAAVKQAEVRGEELLEGQRAVERENQRLREQLAFEQGEAQAGLEAERRRAQEQAQEAQAQLQQLQEQSQHTKKELAQVQSERDSLQSQLATLNVRLGELQAQLEQAKRHAVDLSAKLGSAEAARDSLQAGLEEAKAESSRLQLEIADAKQRLKQEAQRWEQDRKGLQEAAESERRRWERECLQLQGELELERQLVAGVRESLQLLEQQRPQQQMNSGDREQHERQLEQARKERDRLDARIVELQQRLEEAAEREAEVEGWLEEAREQARQLKRSVGDFEDRALALERQRRLAEQRGESLGEQLRLTQQELKQVQEQLALLQQQLAEADNQLAAERERSRLQADRLAGQERAQRLREAQAEETKAALQEALQQRKALEAECASLRGQLEDMRLLGPRHLGPAGGSNSLAGLIEQVEAEVEQRQGLIRENSRLARQLALLQAQLEEALTARLQADESLGRQDGRLRKAQSRIEELEQLVQDAEGRRRRAERQGEEERDRTEQLLKEVARLKLMVKLNN